MGTKSEVEITPAVLKWAIDSSGYSHADLAVAVGVDEATLADWLSKKQKPGTTQLRRLASKLHRQVAVFLLPRPPKEQALWVQFRHPLGAERGRALTPDERRFLRRAKRLQSAESWLAQALERERPDITPVLLSARVEDVARLWRERLAVPVESQAGWRSASTAFDAWRAAVESIGVTVFQFSMGTEACRGFSLWDEWAPTIAVNTAWTDEARIFSLFHELGHLLTRTDSACAAAPIVSRAGDSTERWCEEFAATLLLPAQALSHVGRVGNMTELVAVARRLRVSLRAAAIRLIELGKATWSLYESIPPVSDEKRKGGGGAGRNRGEIREDEFGHRTTELFVSAVDRDIISRSQALDYLDIPSSEFERLTASSV